ncbi:hypothetical protein AUR64_16760 [Haloprofundus marisrubri]|uniref:Uncharacterized protein n=1 Tax=Haloprofundus marisrubri TaxID=1514971 RepID=A0A0W1R8V1_9EURY|nr:hypothetical protein [Haloprofundus marisrubri]KTG09428.1 hypothetical protein AUR64_16760 [Haloprofundus marisrubri]
MNTQYVRAVAIVVALLLVVAPTVPVTAESTQRSVQTSFEERQRCAMDAVVGDPSDDRAVLEAARAGTNAGVCDARAAGARYTAQQYQRVFLGARDGAIEAMNVENNTERYTLADVQNASRGAARAALSNAQGSSPELLYDVAFGGAFGALRAIDVDDYSASFAEAAAEGGVTGALTAGRESGGTATSRTMTYAAYGGASGAMLGVGQQYNESIVLQNVSALYTEIRALTPEPSAVGSGNAGSSSPTQTFDDVVSSASGAAHGAVEATQQRTVQGVKTTAAETMAAAFGSAWSAANSASEADTRTGATERAASLGASKALSTSDAARSSASTTTDSLNRLVQLAYEYTTELFDGQ